MFQNIVKIDAEKKKQIAKDWQEAFPSLKKESKGSSLSRRVGPLVISIWYTYHYGTEYRPVYSTVNLLNVTDGLYAVMSARPKTRRSDITWPQHEKGLYKEAVEELKNLAVFPVDGPITLKQIIDGYKNYEGHIYHPVFLEDPALIAAYLQREDIAKQCLEWGYSKFQERFGKNDPQACEEWLKSMNERISNYKVLHDLLEQEVVRYKLTKIPYEDIVVDM
jgi:hypothetical protein